MVGVNVFVGMAPAVGVGPQTYCAFCQDHVGLEPDGQPLHWLFIPNAPPHTSPTSKRGVGVGALVGVSVLVGVRVVIFGVVVEADVGVCVCIVAGVDVAVLVGFNVTTAVGVDAMVDVIVVVIVVVGVRVEVELGLQAPLTHPFEHNVSFQAPPSLRHVSTLLASPALHRSAPGVQSPPAHPPVALAHPLSQRFDFSQYPFAQLNS